MVTPGNKEKPLYQLIFSLVVENLEKNIWNYSYVFMCVWKEKSCWNEMSKNKKTALMCVLIWAPSQNSQAPQPVPGSAVHAVPRATTTHHMWPLAPELQDHPHPLGGRTTRHPLGLRIRLCRTIMDSQVPPYPIAMSKQTKKSVMSFWVPQVR